MSQPPGVRASIWLATTALLLVLRDPGAADGETCRRAVRREAWADAAARCTTAYDRSGAPALGAALATACLYGGDLDCAARTARQLLETDRRATAHRILGIVRRLEQAFAASLAHATAAVALAAAAGDDRELARDAQALASLWWQLGAFDAALDASTTARDAAGRSGDRRSAGYAELARADALRMLGDRLAGERALDRADALLDRRCDRAWLLLKRGIADIYLGRSASATALFERSLADGERCHLAAVASAARAHLAWRAFELGRLDEAEARLVGDDTEVHVMRALMAARHGDLVAADQHLARAARAPAPDAYWPWLVPHLRAEMARARGHLDAAAALYRTAIAELTALRVRAPASAPYLVATYRLPYEGLFSLHAAAGRWRDALEVLVALDVGDALHVSTPAAVLGVDGLAPAPGTGTGTATARVSLASDPPPASVDDVLRAWASRDLIVAIAEGPRRIGAGGERAWRLRVIDGEVTGEDLGPSADIADLGARLTASPDDRDVALALGRRLVPRAPGGAVLHLLLVGALHRIPLAALRHDDGLVIAHRPLVRALGLRPRRRPPARTGAVVVVGDPTGDLPEARREAAWVAQRFATAPALGAAATITRVAAARDADLLHVAGHASARERSRILALHDGGLPPEAIAAQHLAPRLAVLASCGSAAARDQDGQSSLAAAFLAAGSDAVLATEASVDDAVAFELVRRFYDAGGRTSPAAALATAQRALAGSPGWFTFTVLMARPDAVDAR